MDEIERNVAQDLREPVPEPPARIDVADLDGTRRAHAGRRLVGLVATAVIVAAIAVFVAVVASNRSTPSTADPSAAAATPGPASPAISRPASTRSRVPVGLTGPPNITATVTDRPPPLLPADYTGTGTAHGCAIYSTGPVVTITMDPDGALPGCVIVRAEQRLRIINNRVAVLHGAARAVHLTFAGQRTITIPIGQDLVINTPFGEYLRPGQHFIRCDAGSCIDIWLK